jgi:tRNA threonylcarbamoyladenosine biosynthesis protein TsaE
VILLFGELGSGKTTLTKGIARGLGITKTIVSPTFTLSRFYTIIGAEADTQTAVTENIAAETVAAKTDERKTNVALAAATETSTAQCKIRGLLHLDLYRMLDNPAAGDQIEGLGIDEARENGALVVVEWPEPILESLREYISVRMEVVDEFIRRVEIVSH